MRSHGFDAVHWSAVGPLNAPDRELFDWAREQQAVILTHDLDFGVLLAMTRARGPSVIQARTQNLTPGVLLPMLLEVLAAHGPALEQGAIVSLDERNARVRVLPLHTSGSGLD